MLLTVVLSVRCCLSFSTIIIMPVPVKAPRLSPSHKHAHTHTQKMHKELYNSQTFCPNFQLTWKFEAQVSYLRLQRWWGGGKEWEREDPHPKCSARCLFFRSPSLEWMAQWRARRSVRSLREEKKVSPERRRREACSHMNLCATVHMHSSRCAKPPVKWKPAALLVLLKGGFEFQPFIMALRGEQKARCMLRLELEEEINLEEDFL